MQEAHPMKSLIEPHGSIALEGWTFGRRDRCCAPAASAEPDASVGSRRRRLWDLGGHAHCPVIGVCLPLPAMRRLARKVMDGEPVTDDYELHCGMVADCKRRTPMAEAVQRELDRRFLLPLRRAAARKTEEALAGWWQEQGTSKDLPGALWATLTHPRCTDALEHHVLGQVHMIQHQVGMASRVELARFEALIDENAVLARELAGAQQRSARQAAEHANRVEALQSEVVRLRGQVMAAQGVAAALRQDLHELRSTMPDLDIRRRLAGRSAQQEERLRELLRALQQERGEVARLRDLLAALAAPAAATQGQMPAAQLLELKPRPAAPMETPLAERAVLCVGGRTASVPVYRRLIESRGARFLHHDGGEEHGAGPLESTLAAADLVICQAGCVSHNAYWRVKDHCKRTGKRCVFVDTPSATSLQRALAAIGVLP
jgi:uncharacterized coiled-coil protein SlyX